MSPAVLILEAGCAAFTVYALWADNPREGIMTETPTPIYDEMVDLAGFDPATDLNPRYDLQAAIAVSYAAVSAATPAPVPEATAEPEAAPADDGEVEEAPAEEPEGEENEG